MSIEIVTPEHLTEQEIQDSIEYWEVYAWEAAQKQDSKEFEKAKGHVKALQELLRSSSEPLTNSSLCAQRTEI